ncbi:MAG: FtsX-like permease family protein [Bacteroidales bacterium]
MLRHYITTALRNIKKNKTSFFINLIGLSLGLASAFIISSYVLKEISYDQFHSNKDRIYRVLGDNNEVGWSSPGVPYIIKENIDQYVPVVEKSCLTNYLYMAKVKQGEEFVPFRRLHAINKEFFDIFDCNLIYGNLDEALSNQNSLIITKTTADKYFPNENPVGKIMEINVGAETIHLKIDAVIEDYPQNSSIKFNALCHYDLALNFYESQPWSANFQNEWHLNFSRMYILLKEKNPGLFQKAWNQFEENNNLSKQNLHYYLQPLTDIHFNSAQLVNDGTRGNKNNIYLFSSIAFFILIVAAFNYIILSISISKMRYKEIGIKKIIGSHSSLIKKQFFTESILITLIAFPIAYLLTVLGIDYINQFFNLSLDVNILKNINQLITFLLLLFVLGLISGSYIAFYASRLNPLEIIKFKFENQNRKARFQYIMLLFQIMVFTGLTGASLSIYNQIRFIKNIDTGINLKNKFVVNLDDITLNQTSFQKLNNVIKDIPEIKNSATGVYMPPENSRQVQAAPDPNDPTKNIIYESEFISQNYFNFFDIECIEGRLFNPALQTDSSKIIINEKASKVFGFKDPIGEKINGLEIIGIVNDYHTHSLHEETAPTIYALIPHKYIFSIGIEYHPGLANISANKIKKEIQQLFPEASVNITYIDDKIKAMYSEEDDLNNIISFFSLFAIIIALIGIFGQSLFAVKQQFKEIGIRKVNGATSKDIIYHFLKKYFMLCVIANIISWPVVYIIVNNWQDRFIYKSPVNIWIILITFLITVLIVLVSVLTNAWKASKTNPVNVLQYE